ncbi:MAG: hypothetical protein LBF41_00675, partial [Deltaproteobacteria bacterium]|nr:hypothetical protein [Deltaproteobacteria bacterium]
EASGDFVFFLDADERMTPELARAIEDHARNHKNEVGDIERYNYHNGKKLRFGITCPEYYAKLFPRASVRYEGFVHENALFDLPKRALDGHLVHLNNTFFSMDIYSEKMVRYAKLWAKGAHAKGKTSGPMRAMLEACWSSFKYTFLKLGILGGPRIWAYDLYYSVGYTFLKYQLLAELNEKDQKPEDSGKGGSGPEKA